jgi:hypothetical protein
VLAVENRLDLLNKRYEEYTNAESSILGSAQEYRIGTRLLRRADLKEIADMIQYLEKEIANEQSKQLGKGRNRVFGVIPRDL